jgi:hypothetical protein
MLTSPSSGSFSPPPDLHAQALPSFSTVASLRTRRNPRKPFLFMHLLHNLRTPRGWGYIRLKISSRKRSLVLSKRRRSLTIPFKICTSEKLGCKPRRIRTSKTLDLKLFGMNTYKKTGRGAAYGSPVTSFVPRSYLLARDGSQLFIQASAVGTETVDLAQNRCYIASHTEGLSSSHSADPQPAGRAHTVLPKSSVSLTNHKTKASKSCSRDSWQELRLRCWPVRPPLPFARKK